MPTHRPTEGEVCLVTYADEVCLVRYAYSQADRAHLYCVSLRGTIYVSLKAAPATAASVVPKASLISDSVKPLLGTCIPPTRFRV